MRLGRPPESPVSRFMRYVRRLKTGCWVWVGSRCKSGYGYFNMSHGGRTRTIRAHRASWLLFRGKIPRGSCVLHDCPGGDRPACVNPNHLWLGTFADNAHDRDDKGRAHDRSGGRCPTAKLTYRDVHRLFAARKRGETLEAIGRRFKVTDSHVSSILRRKKWKHLKITVRKKNNTSTIID